MSDVQRLLGDLKSLAESSSGKSSDMSGADHEKQPATLEHPSELAPDAPGDDKQAQPDQPGQPEQTGGEPKGDVSPGEEPSAAGQASEAPSNPEQVNEYLPDEIQTSEQIIDHAGSEIDGAESQGDLGEQAEVGDLDYEGLGEGASEPEAGGAEPSGEATGSEGYAYA